jgi:membrane protein implicated in regulation of membrane protease activity
MDYLNELIQSGSFFLFCALAGSGMFVIQFAINIFGMNSEMAPEQIHDGNLDLVDVRTVKWLSMQTITGFLMMFGWVALACQNELGLSMGPTLGISFGSGLFAALVIRLIFTLAKKLRSSGTVYRIEDAIGKEGYVYQSIPKGGRGKISVELQHFTHEIDAISDSMEEIPSFNRVKIIEKSDDRTVVVIQL